MKKLVCLFIAVACILSVFTFSASAMSVAIDNYETYLGYMYYTATKDLPNDFVPYESIKSIGKFESLTVGSAFNSYSYDIIDTNSYIMSLYVNVDEEDFLNHTEGIMVDTSDMRRIDTKGSLDESSDNLLFYSYNGIQYRYFKNDGALVSIKFQKDGIVYAIYGGDGNYLVNYPLEKNDNTFIGKLLCNPDGAAELIESEIGGGEGYRFNFWLYVVILPTCVVAAVAIGAVILIRRKRMKNNQVNTAN